MIPVILAMCLMSALEPYTAIDQKTIVVAADGSAQFTSVQAAIDSLPDGTTEGYIIKMRPGTYTERLRIAKDKPPISLWGKDPATTRITYKLAAKEIDPATGKPTGTEASSVVSIESDNFVAQDITFENTFGQGSQAVAVKVTGDRVTFRNCRFLGWQDTLYIKAHGRHYFVDCYIEGAVDFIFGRSTAVFENCQIKSLGKGYITAASTEQDNPFGYVFVNCKLTAAESVEPGTVFLGRPWRPCGSVVFMNCELGNHIRPEGWDNWRNPDNEKTARFAEYNNTGPGADTSRRVTWSRQLSDDDAASFAPQRVLAGNDGWNPRRTSPSRRDNLYDRANDPAADPIRSRFGHVEPAGARHAHAPLSAEFWHAGA